MPWFGWPCWWSMPYAGRWLRFPWAPYQISKEEEIAMLEEEKRILETRLAEINKRLEELKGLKK